MKTYKAHHRISKQLRRAIKNCIDCHDELKGSYFWSSGSSASQRRSNEAKWARRHPSFRIDLEDGYIEVITDYSESCRHCYYSMDVIVNGEKKDIRALKKLLK